MLERDKVFPMLAWADERRYTGKESGMGYFIISVIVIVVAAVAGHFAGEFFLDHII